MDRDVKICIYNKYTPKSVVVRGNGDYILDGICSSCTTNETETAYELDATFIIDDNGLYKNIEEESILKVKLDYGYEYFRIAKVIKNTYDIDVFARQITISESLDLWLTDVRPTNMNGQGALTHLLDGAEGVKEIELYSNIQNTNTMYCQNMSLYEAIHGKDNSFLNRWGGEILRRGYKLYINDRIGSDRGVEIRSRKNLTGFEAETDIDDICTRIKPTGKDGITIDGYVESPLIDNYSRVKTKVIKYDDVSVKKEEEPEEPIEPPVEETYSEEEIPPTEEDTGFDTLEEAQAELIRRAELEFSEGNLDKLRAEYRINFIDLSTTEEYKEYTQAERVFIGDTVSVYEENNNIKLLVRAIQRKYDVLDGSITEIVLSNNKIVNKSDSNINDKIDDIIDRIDKVEVDNSALNDYINSIINSGIEDSYVIVRKNEIIIGDNPDINLMINCWRWNKNGLAFSSNGYFGDFSTAITYDGKIVADFIKTGVLNADLIRTGTLLGQYIDARNLSVTREDGTQTIFIDENGNVNLNVNKLQIDSKGVITEEDADGKIAEEINKAKEDLNNRIDDVDNAFNDYKSYVDTIFRDNIVDESEKKLLEDKVKNLNKEKEDIDSKYNELYASEFLINPTKDMLATDYLNYTNKHTELINMINSVIEDSVVDEMEIAKVDILFANYSKLFAKLSTTMNTAIEQISKVRAEREIERAKERIQKEIDDINTKVDDINSNIDGTFKDNILDKVEKDSILSELENLAREKADVDKQYNNYYNNALLDEPIKTELGTSYNTYIGTYNDLVEFANLLINKEELISDEDRLQLASKKNILITSLDGYRTKIYEAIDFISDKENEGIRNDISGELSDISNSVSDLENTMNTAFRDGIVDEIEMENIKSILDTIDKDKASLDNIYNVLYSNPNLV